MQSSPSFDNNGYSQPTYTPRWTYPLQLYRRPYDQGAEHRVEVAQNLTEKSIAKVGWRFKRGGSLGMEGVLGLGFE